MKESSETCGGLKVLEAGLKGHVRSGRRMLWKEYEMVTFSLR